MDPTPANPTGPAYRFGAPFRDRIAPPGARGEPLVFEGRVHHPDGAPVHDVIVDLWHASSRGLYDLFSRRMAFRGRRWVDPDGTFRFHTVVPAGYLWRPPHLHLKVWRGEDLLLTTQVYLAGHLRLRLDPAVQRDLIAPVERSGSIARLRYDLVLPRVDAADDG